MSTIIYRRVFHKIIYQIMSTNIYRRVVHKQTNIFVLKTILHTWQVACVRESGEDSRHGTGHVDIQVGIYIILLECVWLPMHEHLGGE